MGALVGQEQTGWHTSIGLLRGLEVHTAASRLRRAAPHSSRSDAGSFVGGRWFVALPSAAQPDVPSGWARSSAL